MPKANTYQQKLESTSILLLLIVFFSLIRPIMPFITDGIAHHFYSEQHQQLHQLGMNHLDKDLKAANEDDKNSGAEKIINRTGINRFYRCFTISRTESNLYSLQLEAFDFIKIISKFLTIEPPDADLDVCPNLDIQAISIV
ncbi:MAG: hypothetical protein IPI65_14425 [Bacteroidetes bacterium]|nr:hypothetical protein [Bacteroidota bacterium]